MVIGLFDFVMFDVRVVFELPYHLACGWAIHASKTLPPLIAQWRSALLPLAALALAGWMLHRFIRWAIQAADRNRPWRPGHTLAAMALLLSGYAAAITLIGIAHQSTWLLGERWITDGMDTARGGMIAREQTSALLAALEKFRQTRGHYPDSLRELDVPPELLLMETEYGTAFEPFVYLKPSGRLPTDQGAPMIVSPMLGRQWFEVGFTSMDVRAMNRKDLEEMLGLAAPASSPTPALNP